ncbi:TetR/AcrR family transcriptional regulator [Sphingobacterium hotanense]|uniref:TetR/AcrR family transcriptional regulator n=1 Tax=Sphingobacterium TaxID=28453 RepID=UPI0021A40311|nr:TetR/AcrR family transcriptional regulator [Sphingobacterium hotanense]MCT1523655.1 TetR/AcrR family transcriptional regulator [Sphingobacterium hotanense]
MEKAEYLKGQVPKRKYNRAQTIQRLIDSVGEVISKHGYSGLRPTNIGKVSGLDRKLIYTYFGSFDKLVEAYLRQKSFYRPVNSSRQQDQAEKNEEGNENTIGHFLGNEMQNLMENDVLPQLILWQLSGRPKVLKKFTVDREIHLGSIISQMETAAGRPSPNFRAGAALMIGGVTFLSLYAKNNGGIFNGIQTDKKEEMNRVFIAATELLEAMCAKSCD